MRRAIALQVTAKGVVIKAKTGKGAFYGMQTLPAAVASGSGKCFSGKGGQMGGTML